MGRSSDEERHRMEFGERLDQSDIKRDQDQEREHRGREQNDDGVERLGHCCSSNARCCVIRKAPTRVSTTSTQAKAMEVARCGPDSNRTTSSVPVSISSDPMTVRTGPRAAMRMPSPIASNQNAESCRYGSTSGER